VPGQARKEGRRPRASAGVRPAGAEAELELAELFGHAARRLRHGSVAQLAPLGLTMAQSRILRLVASAPMRMADIAARMGVVPRTVTPMVDGLAGNGLVERTADPGDRRSVLVTLTPAGRRLLDGLDRARRASAGQIFGVLDERERKELLVLLTRLCERGGCAQCEHEHHDHQHGHGHGQGHQHGHQDEHQHEHGAR